MIDLSARRALVTGGATGIGRGIARRLAEAGANVAIGHLRTPEAAAETVVLLAPGAESLVVEADMRDRPQVDAMVARVVEAWGGLDIMVCNAGLYADGPFLDFPVERLEALLNTNLVGTWNCAQSAARAMVAAGRGGRIVLISSTQGNRPLLTCSAYAMTKGALKTLALALARELAPHAITVNTISPGAMRAAGNIPLMEIPERRAFIEGNIPLGRIGDPLDVGAAVAFLASDEGGYITGHDLIVDGGLLLQGPQV